MIQEIRCSQLARPMSCAGFLSFTDLPEQETSAPAEEGTAFGELVERMLLTQPIPLQARNGIYFDDDMKFYAKPIVEEIISNLQSEVLCEQPIDWRTRSGIWIRGRFDISFVRDGSLYIDDCKYGWGLVEVKENWQLLGYAIGEVIRRQQAFESVVLRIRQPRPHHEDGDCREWKLTYQELLGYKEQIESRMEQLANGHKELQTGKQCKYCPAAAQHCPAFNKLFYRALEVTHEFTQDQIDETELARQMDHVSRAQEVIKIKKDSLDQLAVQRIKTGKIIPGYSTEERYGDRQWKGGVSPAAIEALTGRKIVEEVMLSPAKAEKAGVPKEFVNSLVDRRFLGQKIVKKDGSDVGNKIFGKNKPDGT